MRFLADFARMFVKTNPSSLTKTLSFYLSRALKKRQQFTKEVAEWAQGAVSLRNVP